MPVSVIKKGLIGIVVAAIVVALAIAALPFLVSTTVMRDRIAQEIGTWSGYRVGLGAAPEITLLPSPRAVLKNVTLSRWGSGDAPPVIRSERVEIDLSPFAALRGRVSFSAVTLTRVQIRLERRADGSYGVPLPTGGRFMRAVTIARDAVAANPSDPDISQFPSETIGNITIRDGRLIEGDDTELLSSFNGELSWPAVDRRAIFNGNAIWHGETVSLDATANQFLVLLAGGIAPLNLKISAAPLAVSFDGAASISDLAFIDGNVELSSPSLRRTLEWFRTEIEPGEAIGAVGLVAKASGDLHRLKLEEAEITLGGNTGIGALNYTFNKVVPELAGTLAFDRLDLKSFVSAFTELPIGTRARQSEIDTAFIDQINLDLRLSASEATAGQISLSGVAATANIKEGLAVFDISDSTAFSGNVQAGFRIDRKDGNNHGEVRLLASDVDAAAFTMALGQPRLVPEATGTISIILKGPIEDWESIPETASGSIVAKFGAGRIVGLDFSTFLDRVAKDGFFSLGSVSEGSLTIEQAELKATISEGVAQLEKAEVTTTEGTIALAGIVPYLGRSLALSGAISAPPAESGDGEDTIQQSSTIFFVGGSWDNPFISPVLSPLRAN